MGGYGELGFEWKRGVIERKKEKKKYLWEYNVIFFISLGVGPSVIGLS